MGVYPMMYVLFNTERLLNGFQDLRPYELPNHTEAAYHDHAMYKRHYRFTDSPNDLRHALTWMHGGRHPPFYEGGDPHPNVFYFTLGDPHAHFSDVTFEFLDNEVTFEFLDDNQTLLPAGTQERYVIAQVAFDGPKNGCFLSPFQPAWPIIHAVLEATQPVHAVVTGDVYSVDGGTLELHHIAYEVGASTFIGPEQLASLPADAFQNFAIVEPIGDGVWVTIPSPNVNGTWDPEATIGRTMWERQHAAARVLTQQLSEAWRL